MTRLPEHKIFRILLFELNAILFCRENASHVQAPRFTNRFSFNMDEEDLYDEFGTYIGPDVGGADDSDQESFSDEWKEEVQEPETVMRMDEGSSLRNALSRFCLTLRYLLDFDCAA